jgi:ectoine hydroxylase-related dioxygenase (phytanoyl-CoA dioxygenase family)
VQWHLAHALDSEGFAVIPGVLDPLAIQQIRYAFHCAAQDEGTQHVRLTAEMPHYDAWVALRDHQQVLAAAEHVLSGPSRVRDLHGRNPLPGYGQQGLHTDWPARAPGAPYVVMTALWMLDDFTEDNGATRVVPGTHRMTGAIPKDLNQPLARHPHEARIVAAAGSVLLFNGHLWHSGTKNRSSGPRRVVQMVLERR